ncbi:hypothetical protein FOZ60_002457 [Perkinsus olseni]|uniref:EamA domain-containing protein n=2 Tax=Perkinsus olseni TaxID=32597 RepID=A0A7J6P078_PEROL|nr:hypothetical protein FOZ60_002457 [Perkinsus olseni]
MKSDFSTESTSPLLAKTGSNPSVSNRPRANSRGDVHMGLGVVFLFISAIAFSTMSFLASIASRWFASSETMFVRCIMQLIFAWLACRAAKVPVLPSIHAPHHLFWWVMLRGLFGAAGNWILYYSLSQLPLADASSLFFTQPMFTLTLAPILIHEKIVPRQVLAVLLAVCGVFFIAHPTWLFGASAGGYEAMGNVDAQLPRWLAIIICLCGSFCSAMVFITVSNIGRRAHWAQLVFAFAIIGTCVATIPLISQLAPLKWPRGVVPYIVIVSVGCCALVGQSTFNYGMQLCQSAVTSSLVRQSDLIFAFIYQALFLKPPSNLVRYRWWMLRPRRLPFGSSAAPPMEIMSLMSLNTAKLLAILAAVLVALAGLWAAKEIGKIKKPLLFSVSQAFTAGVLFAAGLCHMLPDAVGDLVEAYVDYQPQFGALLACTSAAVAFLLLLSIEEIVSALLPASTAVPHSDAACVTYKAQFSILPRKELVGPHGCCEGGDPDSCCEAIDNRNAQEKDGLVDPLLPRYHNECCPVHEHDHVHHHSHSINQADIEPSIRSWRVWVSDPATHSWEVVPVLTAILAHKALAAFALGCSLVESAISERRYIVLSLIFAAGTPVGALFGDIGVSSGGSMHTAAVFSAVCKALASGTFLQVSSMEIIPQVFASAEGRFSKLTAVLVGFGAMAVLALWI